ncbi:MAG: XdhC family protein [Achromobacter sp.]|uniref:XdhC family protein n=1 Tax=Achromobacter sp. TaxID=134375 RepID=UPI0029AE2D3D|nr:XdhC family protein [Achromobacter sp.]MDX3987987.1 XdhC family protein [Achromobacter sp.]
MTDINILVLRQAMAWQQAGIPAWLFTVVRTWGSSPRPAGSIMAMNAQGAVVGSVSGGCIEDDLADRVRALGDDAHLPVLMRYGVLADDARRFGIPCGGTVQLLMERIGAHSLLPELLQACVERRCVTRTVDLSSGHTRLQGAQPDIAPQLTDATLTVGFGPTARLIVIGAGDTSRYLCQIALTLGFEIIVCDPRESHQGDWAQDGITFTREMPDDVILRVQPDARTAVVALTHDPKLDDLALIDALQSNAFYVGAIGSRKNSEQRRARLREYFDLTDADLHKLRGPAGVFIGSKTPAEIALSIMAEVVAAKNGVSFLAAAALTRCPAPIDQPPPPPLAQPAFPQ